jgi:hypothetical protein
MTTQPRSNSRMISLMAALLAAGIVLLACCNLAFDLANDVFGQGFVNAVYAAVNTMAVVPFALVGALIVWYQSRNAIGWLLLVIAGSITLTGLGTSIGMYALVLHSGSLPGAIWIAWLVSWLPPVWLVAIPLIPLLFPTGRPRTRPGYWVAAAMVAYGATLFLFAALRAELLLYDGTQDVVVGRNPVGVIPQEVITFLSVPSLILLVLFLVASIVSLGLRYWHGARIERQQIKWLLAAVALVLAVLVLTTVLAVPDPLNGTLQTLTLYTIPIAIGIAILRYRLYDIDVIIRKTLVYSVLTVLLALIYFGGVVLVQQLTRSLTASSDLAIVVSTLIIAALFFPLRRRVQNAIDRRFYRRKYDARKVLEHFAATARDEVELEKLTAELINVVNETMQPASVSLWLKREEKR